MIGYKIAQIKKENSSKRVLVTLDIPNDAKTNFNRSDIVDKLHAKYRCNKCKVIKINDEDGNIYNEAYPLFNITDNNFKYILNEEIIINNYKENENVICGEGIHYFIDETTALTYRLIDVSYRVIDNIFQLYSDNKLKDGLYIEYNHNGSINNIYQFKNNKFNGEQKSYENGKIRVIYNVKNNIFDGISYHYKNNKIYKEIIYKNGKRA